ncbi:MAG: hypothetical protein ABIH27_04580, partial [Candidatus Omnitrophota bacterium]
MKRIKVFLLIPLVFITLCLDRSYAADNRDLAIEFIYEYAKNLYQRGDIEGAKHEFNKILLIAPDNQAALGFLKKLGEDPLNENTPPELLSQEYLESFKDDMNFMINKVTILEGKNKEFASAIKVLEDNNQLLRSNLNQAMAAPKEKLTKADFSPKILDLQYQLSLMENNLQKKEAEVKGLKSQVAKLSAESGNLNEKNSLMKNLEAQIIKYKTTAEQRQAEYEDKLKTAGDVFLAKNQELSKQNTLISLEKEQNAKDLKSQVETLRVSLVNKDNEIKQLDNKVQQVMKISDDFAGKIESLNKESLKNNSQFKESAMKIADYESKIKTLSGLQSQLKIAQDSLANKDNSILAKDKQIQVISLSLKDQEKQVDTQVKQIAKLNSDYSQQTDSLKNEIKNNDILLKGLQARLDQTKKESEQKINDYQAKINESSKSWEQVKSDKDKQIAKLQE